MSLISTIFYLWKNTLKRWFESPVTPLSRFALVFVIGFFAMVSLAALKGIETEIDRQILGNDLNSVIVTEIVSKQEASERLQESILEELMWSERFENSKVSFLWRASISAFWRREPIQVFSVNNLERFDGLSVFSGIEIPEAYLLVPKNFKLLDSVYKVSVEFDNKEIEVSVANIPDWFRRDLNNEQVIVAPIAFLSGILQQGFSLICVASFEDVNELKRFVKEFEAYNRAQGNRITLRSSLALIEKLERFKKIEINFRIMLTWAVALIFALIFGTMAWLEFREERFLLALLRSFGTSSFLLCIHSFIENIVLVGLALLALPLIWQFLLPVLGNLGVSQFLLVDFGDVDLVDLMPFSTGMFVGCLLAMGPVWFGLRKPVGLILS